MTRRLSVPVLALLFSAVVGTSSFAQSTAAGPAKSDVQAAVPAKWGPAPFKGEGTIEVIKSKPRRVGSDMVTTLKIKNTSSGALALLIVDEYWYGPTSKDAISGDTQRYRGRLEPGQIIEITTKSPWRAEMNRNLFMFRHANGTIKPKEVAKFSTPK
jgi:hypothetical protein